MPEVRLVVSDMAGTTVKDDGVVEHCFIQAMVAVGVRDDARVMQAHLQVVRETMGQSKIVVFRQLLDGDEDRAAAANLAFEDAYARQVQDGRVVAMPGAVDAMAALADAGIAVALTTGFADATRLAILDALGWGDGLIGSWSPGPGRRGRPHPDLVLTAVMAAEVDDVREVCVIGDTSSDLLSGTRAGASVVVGVLSGAHRREQLVQAPHTHIIESVAALPALLLT